MSTRVGLYSRERPRVRNYLGMRLNKEVTNSIQEEVMSTDALPKRYNLEGFDIDIGIKQEATEIKVHNVRVDGCFTVESPTFPNDVGTD